MYLYRMFSIWLHTIGVYYKQFNATIIITIVLYTIDIYTLGSKFDNHSHLHMYQQNSI